MKCAAHANPQMTIRNNPEPTSSYQNAYLRQNQPRSHLSYGITKWYRGGIENADLVSLAKLIKIVGFLLQKVYLF